MMSQITTYFHIVILATCFSVLITQVSGLYCVQCTSATDPMCQLAGMHESRLCPALQNMCVTTVILRHKSTVGGIVTRGCTSSEASGCRVNRGVITCKIPCRRSGCNAVDNFYRGGLPMVTAYGGGL